MNLLDDLKFNNVVSPCETEWGKWWQNSEEVHIEVNVPKGTKSKDVKIDFTNSNISVNVTGKNIFSGTLFKKVKGAESLWSIEGGGTVLDILLIKLSYVLGEEPWAALMEDSRFKLEDSAFQDLKKNEEMEKITSSVMKNF